MGDRFIVSHDVGTGGSKAVLTDLAGNIIASSFEPYPVSYPQPHWAEQDPRDWWKAVAASTQRVVKESKINPRQVAGTGFATQMLGVLPVDELRGAPAPRHHLDRQPRRRAGGAAGKALAAAPG